MWLYGDLLFGHSLLLLADKGIPKGQYTNGRCEWNKWKKTKKHYSEYVDSGEKLKSPFIRNFE
jgi:hypothetical protein